MTMMSRLSARGRGLLGPGRTGWRFWETWGARRRERAEEERRADAEATDFISTLMGTQEKKPEPQPGRHRKPPPTGPMLKIGTYDLPSLHRTITRQEVTLNGQQPPWGIASIPPLAIPSPMPVIDPAELAVPQSGSEPGGEEAPAVRPGDPPAPGEKTSGPPTIVMKVVRPAIKSDLLRYLDELPAYKDEE